MFDHVTPEQRQNIERYNNDLQYRAEIDAKFATQRNFDDQRWQNTDDGLTPEAPRQTIQYHEGFHFDIVTFLLAVLVVVVVVFLSCPLLTTLLHLF